MKERLLPRPPGARSLLVATLALALGVAALAGSAGASDDELGSSVVEVILPDRDAVDRLVATGTDVAHEVGVTDDGIVAQVVVTPAELADLRAQGFTTGRTLYTPDDAAQRLAERAATIAAKQNGGTAALRRGQAKAAVDALNVLRADYFTSLGNHVLSIEIKSSAGATSTASLNLQFNSGPGTPMGSGSPQRNSAGNLPSGCTQAAGGGAITCTVGRYVDAGAYMYHRRLIQITGPTTEISVTSAGGGATTAPAREWLPVTDPGTGLKFQDFVDHYMDPTELNARIEQLNAEFPELTDIVELPNRTNGYQRKAQGILAGTADPDGSPGPSTAQQAYAVVAESLAWGQEGGNDLLVELRNPGVADSPLSVTALGNWVVVSLATNAAGALTSTAAQVVAAINATPSIGIRAFTYRGNAGAGIVQPRAATQLRDFLNAPASVKRGPATVKLLRIRGNKNVQNTGVYIYAQEHAREWVPPVISVEFAERLLRNYAVQTRTRQLVNQLDIFILPSANPDGGNYAFYDDNGQRRTMTRHCTDSNGDPGRRADWGVDMNRNYAIGSIFDGYSGASSSCISDTYSGPAELSEPESANVAWVPDAFPNVKYSMNMHSSGNYFMWAPGAYKTSCNGVACRELLPRPDAGTEAYFWAASQRVLTDIKKYRGLAVTPGQTGPVADVLYSAAGNSGDHLYYDDDVFGWDFEVGGAGFQPQWSEAHSQMMEFSNGLMGLLEVAWARDHDWYKPASKVTVLSREPGKTRFMLESNEPSVIFYTLDGSKPTPESARYPVNGDREYGKIFEVTARTTVSYYAVDMAGNIENGYKAGGQGVGGNRFNKATVTVD